MIYQGYLGKVVLRSDCTAILYDTVTRYKFINFFIHSHPISQKSRQSI